MDRIHIVELKKSMRRLAFAPMVGSLMLLGIPATQAQNQYQLDASEYEYEPEQGLHQEEWYDPTDWVDSGQGVTFEEDTNWDQPGQWFDDDRQSYRYQQRQGYAPGVQQRRQVQQEGQVRIYEPPRQVRRDIGAMTYQGRDWSGYEYEQGQGLHREEWYDPTDWLDSGQGVSFEEDIQWDQPGQWFEDQGTGQYRDIQQNRGGAYAYQPQRQQRGQQDGWVKVAIDTDNDGRYEAVRLFHGQDLQQAMQRSQGRQQFQQQQQQGRQQQWNRQQRQQLNRQQDQRRQQDQQRQRQGRQQGGWQQY